jgi:hypothetical protein
VTLAPNGTAIARVTCPAEKRPIIRRVSGLSLPLSSSIPIDDNRRQGAFKNLTANPATIRAHAVWATVAL